MVRQVNGIKLYQVSTFSISKVLSLLLLVSGMHYLCFQKLKKSFISEAPQILFYPSESNYIKYLLVGSQHGRVLIGPTVKGLSSVLSALRHESTVILTVRFLFCLYLWLQILRPLMAMKKKRKQVLKICCSEFCKWALNWKGKHPLQHIRASAGHILLYPFFNKSLEG